MVSPGTPLAVVMSVFMVSGAIFWQEKILPLKKFVTISGKITYFRNNYQITNPGYVSGDKNKITVFGESAGGSDIAALLLS